MYKIIPRQKIYLSISGVFVALSILALFVFGLNFGIDFTGGSLLEVKFVDTRPSYEEIKASLNDFDLGNLVIQPSGEKNLILKFQDTSEEKHQAVLTALEKLAAASNDKSQETSTEINSDESTNGTSTKGASTNGASTKGASTKGASTKGASTKGASTTNASGTEASETNSEKNIAAAKVVEMRFDSVGPSIGEELKSRSITAIIVVIIAIVLYIAWAFRKVSKPVASWKYGLAAIVALFHDVLITIGVFAVLGAILKIEINTPFVAAILTVLGYSVNDTIVVFDRLRENLPKSDEDFAETSNISVNQTISRSINTSATTLVVLLSILFFGGASIRAFVLALSIGVFVGTYSSIFIASPILVIWEKLGRQS